MIYDWQDLACTKNPVRPEYNELKLWLRSQTQNSTTVSTTSHSLDMLVAMLQAATHEIRDNLDEQIAMLVAEADSYHIVIRQGDYYRTRHDDWDSMLPTDIDEMRAEECVELLHAARKEIAWLVNEICRLQCYIRVEQLMDHAGIMGRRPVLRPYERKGREQENNCERGDRRCGL